MNAYLSLGRLFFPITFITLGVFHLLNAVAIAEKSVPAFMPMPSLWVYLAGAGLLLGGISMYLGKFDKLAATLIAVYLTLIILAVHLPATLEGGAGSQIALTMLVKDLGLMAGCMMYATYVARDRSVTG